jgi:hypothetical protein
MRKYRRGKKVMRGGALNNPTQEFLDWWGNEPGKMNWSDFLKWYGVMIRQNTKAIWPDKMFESWLINLPSHVLEELHKAFNAQRKLGPLFNKDNASELYSKMTGLGSGAILKMSYAASKIQENEHPKLKEMLLRLGEMR